MSLGVTPPTVGAAAAPTGSLTPTRGRRTSPESAVAGPTDVDVVVIGGGLLGCALAWMLARDGCSVTLLERDQLNAHASGQNAGSLHFQLEYRMVELGYEQAQVAAEAMPLHLRAAQLWGELADAVGESLGVEQHGGLMLAETSEQVDLLVRKAELERSWGLDVRVIDGDELRNTAPYLSRDVAAAAFCPLEGKADARIAGPAFGRAAARDGATIRTGSEVVGLDRDGRRWRVQVRRTFAATAPEGQPSYPPGPVETVRADAVVLAAGLWTTRLGALAGANLPTIPLALTMSVTAKQAPLIPHLIQHVGKRLSLKQSHDGNFLIGGGWPAQFRTGYDGSPDIDRRPALMADSLARNALAAVEVVPSIAHVPVLRSWAGATTIAADQLPLVGPVPDHPGLFVATGGSAFTLGPAFAELLTALVQGRSIDTDITPYDPVRYGGSDDQA